MEQRSLLYASPLTCKVQFCLEIWTTDFGVLDRGVSKNRGKTPKMDGL